MREKVLLMAIILLGIFLRLNNISPFKIYPDSYQNLLVAKNIVDYHGVVGYLGTNGMLFPDFFTWTRPAYALLINFFTFFTNDMTLSGQIIAAFLGIMAIPLTYFLIKQIFHKNFYGLAGALIIALSFNHAVWGGFIMTETTSVFFMILFLWNFFASLPQKTRFGNPRDFLTGIFLSFTIITRYEYIILIFPIIFLSLATNRFSFPRLINIFSAFLICISFVALLLFPIDSSLAVILTEIPGMLTIISFLIIFFFLLALTIKIFPQLPFQMLNQILYKFSLLFLWSVAMLVVLQIILEQNMFLWNEFYFLRNFVINDFLISIFSFIGLTLMFQKSQFRNYGIFILFSLVTLGFIYYKVNPEMERYMTHLIPFLLIPASYGLVQILKQKKHAVSVMVIILLTLQTVFTYQGLRTSQDASWFRISYEEKAAEKIKQYIAQEQDPLLIVSLPEPYYYHLQVSTHSITNEYPYIYIDETLDNQIVFLVSDMPMHEIFPTFSNFIANNLQKYKLTEFWVQENYHYIDTTYKEKYPVILYKMTLKELKNKIKESYL
jgi:hypothetical protein